MGNKPKLVTNLDGDYALKVQSIKGRMALVDLRCVLGVVEPTQAMLKMEDLENCRTIIMAPWGGICTDHDLVDLEQLLYPYEANEDV